MKTWLPGPWRGLHHWEEGGGDGGVQGGQGVGSHLVHHHRYNHHLLQVCIIPPREERTSLRSKWRGWLPRKRFPPWGKVERGPKEWPTYRLDWSPWDEGTSSVEERFNWRRWKRLKKKYSKRMRAVPSVVVPSGKIRSLRCFEDHKEPSWTWSPRWSEPWESWTRSPPLDLFHSCAPWF